MASLSRALRVGLLLNTYDATAGIDAGGFVHLIEVVRRWTGVDVTIFAPESGRRPFCAAFPMASFVALPNVDGYTRGRALTFLGRALVAPLTRRKLRSCDVLLVLSPFLPDIVPALFFGPKNCVVQLWHLQDPPWKRPGAFAHNMLAYANERIGLLLLRYFFPALIVGTPQVARQLNAKHKRVYVTTNGVDHLQLFAQSGEARKGGVFIGRLHPSKGVEDLIAAWDVVVRELGPIPLNIIGDGMPEYRALLQLKIDVHGLSDSVHLAGRVSEEEKARLLNAAEVFVFPSYEEGWGIAIAEAMAAQLPCVTYDLPVFDEVFTSGRVSAPLGSVEQLADRICNVLRDDALRERLSSEATTLASGFSWQRAADIELDALRSLPFARSLEEAARA